MLNKIVDGISSLLADSYGEGYKIYTESVKQGLKEPCFFINQIGPSSDQLVKDRCFRHNLFCIQYFPSGSDYKSECNDVADNLFHILEYIKVDGALVRGTKMRCETNDGILNFFVNYDLFVLKQEELTAMEELESSNINLKG